jgi:hypothetical protein
MTRQRLKSAFNRRQVLKGVAATGIAASVGCGLTPDALAAAEEPWHMTPDDEAFLDDLQRRACMFFWDQGSHETGQILDRARNDLNGSRDPRRMASIASTGFGLSALCIADHRGYLPHAQLLERVKTCLAWHLNTMPEVRGFFYHFTDIETGARYRGAELSSIDTAILLCGMQTARAHFDDPQIHSLAQQIYDRVDWPWMLNGARAFSMGWQPESGFLKYRWEHYCELMMIDLLAIASRTHPIPAEYWNNFSRSFIHYKDYDYISGNDPLFTHQYSQAWFDFRNKRDAYANYYTNSIIATRAHKAFCLSYPNWYNEDYWGITSSDYVGGYTAWGGPPALGPIDGTVVPSATAGSLAFLPIDCISVLKAMRSKWGSRAWGQYGFVDAFHPAANWYDPDVLGIDQGISVLMAENLRSGFIWDTFMRNSQSTQALKLAGFTSDAKP